MLTRIYCGNRIREIFAAVFGNWSDYRYRTPHALHLSNFNIVSYISLVFKWSIIEKFLPDT